MTSQPENGTEESGSGGRKQRRPSAALPNLVTLTRILFSAALLGFPAFSAPFYAFYAAAGLTDVLDGYLARRLGAASAFGAKLDTAADFVFAAVCLCRLIPVLALPRWLLIWIAAVALIKGINLASGFLLRKRFVAPHTRMNKITGALLFALPLTWTAVDPRIGGAVTCAAATFAAVQEGHFIRTGKDKEDIP